MSILNTQYQKIYVINLDHREDRMNHMKNLLNKYQVNYFRFPAINGKRRDIYHHWYRKMISNKKCKLKSPGSFGYLLSFFYILQDAISNNYEQILVFDDDVLFHQNIVQNLEQLALPINWKLIYYGACHQNHRLIPEKQMLNSEYFRVNDFQQLFGRGNIDGSHMVGLHSSIYKELCHLIKTSLLPFDSGPLKSIYTKYPSECFVIYPYLAIQDLGDSDIQDNFSDNNKNRYYKMWGWNLKNYC